MDGIFPAGDQENKREIGDEAVWTLSSAKQGNGVEQLRDDNVVTFWQSDGSHPHLLNIQFHKKMNICDLAIYTDFKLDESYTPARIAVRGGTGLHDLHELQVLELEEPTGWLTIKLRPLPDAASDADADEGACLRAHMLQLAVLSSHQNGRDTHLRQVKVFGPRRGNLVEQYSSLEFREFAQIR
jgi:anaphase-promoting complex subunit 10